MDFCFCIQEKRLNIPYQPCTKIGNKFWVPSQVLKMKFKHWEKTLSFCSLKSNLITILRVFYSQCFMYIHHHNVVKRDPSIDKQQTPLLLFNIFSCLLTFVKKSKYNLILNHMSFKVLIYLIVNLVSSFHNTPDQYQKQQQCFGIFFMLI